MFTLTLAPTKQTAFRLPPVLLEKLKVAANQAHISMNEYVRKTLEEATRDVETAAERAARFRKTEAFLASVYGLWVSSKDVGDMAETLSQGRTSNTPVDL